MLNMSYDFVAPKKTPKSIASKHQGNALNGVEFHLGRHLYTPLLIFHYGQFSI